MVSLGAHHHPSPIVFGLHALPRGVGRHELTIAPAPASQQLPVPAHG